MSAASPVVRAQEEKTKKQKRLLAVLSVILLALMGYELPKMLGGSGSASTSPPSTIAVDSLPGASPSLLPSVGPGTLPNTDDRLAAVPASGKLISFGLFKSKDPFVQQLSTLATPGAVAPVATTPLTGATGPASPVVTVSQPHPPIRSTITGKPVTTVPATLTPASPAPAPSTTPITPTPVSTTPVRTRTTPRPATTTPAAPGTAPISVAISTNGECELVAVNGLFPRTENIFRVVSIARDGKSAKIAVVGGAYDSGVATVTIKLGERVTLVNTADGTRYVILLTGRCDVEASPVPGTATTSPTTTVAPPATTSSGTTPIVTDSLDTTTPTP
jgi:hypothetical protein